MAKTLQTGREEVMIEIKNVTKIYSTKKKQVVGVDNVSLTIQDGEIFGIIGYSGAGKSTLLRCLNLLERPTSGQVVIDGVDLTALDDKQLRQARLKIGMIFQHFYLVSSKTVFENVAFALKAAKSQKTKSKSESMNFWKWSGFLINGTYTLPSSAAGKSSGLALPGRLLTIRLSSYATKQHRRLTQVQQNRFWRY
jgi:ABC-type ATPase involved in cell division